jgi:hypothetical protein
MYTWDDSKPSFLSNPSVDVFKRESVPAMAILKGNEKGKKVSALKKKERKNHQTLRTFFHWHRTGDTNDGLLGGSVLLEIQRSLQRLFRNETATTLDAMMNERYVAFCFCLLALSLSLF